MTMSEQALPAAGNTRALLDELDRYRFLARLDAALEGLAEPGQIAQAAARLLCAHLAGDHCRYLDQPGAGWDCLAEGLQWVATDPGSDQDAPPGPTVPACIVDDGKAAARFAGYLPPGMDAAPGALMAAPVIEDGQALAWMLVAQDAPRHWTAHDIALLSAVARRCHALIENQRMGTALRSAEKRIRADHDYLRLLIDSGEEGFYSVDRDGVTVMCNTAFLKMLGFAREEDAVGRKLHGVIHHRHPDGSAHDVRDCPIYQSARFGTFAHVEDDVFFRTDGSEFPVAYRARPVWQDGELQGAVCTFVDVTERRRTELALRQSEAHLASLFAQTGAGISEAD
ncbi:MAG: PAS domain S-box protein, partial [Oxalobacteraceae bacterium]